MESEPLIRKSLTSKVFSGVTREAFEESTSTILDIWKGLFVFFMLTEHTRSSLDVEMSTMYPFMHLVSQVACALDMTTFSTAYGFSCFRSYLFPGVKKRSGWDTAMRVFRSVGLIYSVAIVCNVLFATQVEGIPPSLGLLWEMASLSTVLWDFLLTFPLLLLLGALTTGPVLRVVKNKHIYVKLAVFGMLLLWPLVFAQYSFNISSNSDGSVLDCQSKTGRYAALFVGCSPQTFKATRFPAIPYMFFFNLGCIASMVLLEFSLTLPSRNQPVHHAGDSSTEAGDEEHESFPMKAYGGFFASLVLVEFVFALPLLINSNEPWENYDRLLPTLFGSFHYHRFPIYWPLVLGWAFLSFIALITGALIWYTFKPLAKLIEGFGANVLLYFLINVIIIQGFFNDSWRKARKSQDPDTRKQWELTTVTVSLGTMATTMLVMYLARSARK